MKLAGSLAQYFCVTYPNVMTEKIMMVMGFVTLPVLRAPMAALLVILVVWICWIMRRRIVEIIFVRVLKHVCLVRPIVVFVLLRNPNN